MQNVILSPIPLTDLVELIGNEVKKVLPIKEEPKPQNETNLEGYYTRKEVSDLFHISLVTLNKHTKNKRLNAHRIGSRVLYKKSEVLQALTTIK